MMHELLRSTTVDLVIPFALALVLPGIAACGGGSHNTGRDCLECHRPGGSGDGTFTAAGTIYEGDGTTAAAGVTVEIYSAAGSSSENLVATLETDDSGNFYTKTTLDFAQQTLFPVVVDGTTRVEKPMVAASGACNSCHNGSTAARLTVE